MKLKKAAEPKLASPTSCVRLIWASLTHTIKIYQFSRAIGLTGFGWVTVYTIYLIFFILSPLLFFSFPPRAAILLVFLGGWLLLPVGNYPVASLPGTIPWWIVGLAVPSDMLITKAW